MYKAVFTDMDGTLLLPDHTISKRNKEVIEKLFDKGIVVIPVSARPLHGILPITRSVINDSIPVVSLNGGYITQQEQVLRDVRISLQDTAAVYKSIQDAGVTPMFYSQLDWYSITHNDEIKKEQRITDVQVKVQPFEMIMEEWQLSNNGPNKIMMAGEKNIVQEVQQQLRKLYNDRLNIYTSQPRYLEIMNHAASKKTGLEFLMHKFGFQREETIAIGDNFNDSEMIAFAGMGIAMGNAPEEVKTKADYITDTNINDGFAKALEDLIL